MIPTNDVARGRLPAVAMGDDGLRILRGTGTVLHTPWWRIKARTLALETGRTYEIDSLAEVTVVDDDGAVLTYGPVGRRLGERMASTATVIGGVMAFSMLASAALGNVVLGASTTIRGMTPIVDYTKVLDVTARETKAGSKGFAERDMTEDPEFQAVAKRVMADIKSEDSR